MVTETFLKADTDEEITRFYIDNNCVAVWEKHWKDAKLVIEKIDQKIIKGS